MDQYKQRYEFFISIKDFLVLIISRGTISEEEISRFYSDAQEQMRLFDKSIQEYIEELCSRSKKLDAFNQKIVNMPIGCERDKMIGEHSTLMIWFVNEIKKINSRFEKYLGSDLE